MRNNYHLLILLFLPFSSCHRTTDQTHPNIVIIIADDIGFSDFGCYGGEIPTPNIDRIAKQGIRFTQYYTENMCAPSRAALLTGRYAMRGYEEPNNVTIAEALSTAGYNSYAVGKWHNAGETIRDKSAPLKRGFDHFFGTPQGTSNYFAPIDLTRDGESAADDWKDGDFYYTDAITANAVQYIKNTPEEKPLFLYTAYNAAHWPLHAPEEAILKQKGRYSMGWDELRKQRLDRMKALGMIPEDIPLSERDELVPAWEEEPDKAWQERRMEVYAAQIAVMDEGIGKILEELERSGRLENTLLMVLVDNGGCHVEYEPERRGPFLNKEAITKDGRPMKIGNNPEVMPGPADTWQSYGRGWANLSNTPFRLYKKYDHEGGIRVPLIVQWPSVVKEGGIITDQIGHVTDLLPTLLDAASVKYPTCFNERKIDPADGISLLSALKGDQQIKRDPLFWEWADGAAARKEDWKIVRVGENPWELYDLSEDPVENNNLAGKYPEEVKELDKLWRNWKQQEP